jgi:hypothetical protein
MTRLAFSISALLALGAGACGGGGGDDDDTGNEGFLVPTSPCADSVSNFHPCHETAVTQAYQEIDGTWTLQGDADWSCLNTPTDDVPSTEAITLTGLIDDFQTGNPVSTVAISAFNVIDIDNPLATTTSDEDGLYTMTLPVGVERVGFDMTAEGQMRTLLLNQYFEPAVTDQEHDMSSVSVLTTQALSAFIGVTRTEGRGVVAGALRDCNNHEVAGAIATVAAASGTSFADVMHVYDEEECTGTNADGDPLPDCTQTYYFSAGSTSLPVQHSLAPSTNRDGLFMIIELPGVSGAVLQLWGFVDEADVADGEPTLLSEIPTPVIPDVVVTFSIEPLRTE